MIDFPQNPTNNMPYDYQGVRYVWVQPDPAQAGYWRVGQPGAIPPATATEIDEGTSNSVYVTPKGLKDSHYLLSGEVDDILTELVANNRFQEGINYLLNGNFTHWKANTNYNVNQGGTLDENNKPFYAPVRWRGQVYAEDTSRGILSMVNTVSDSDMRDGHYESLQVDVTPHGVTEEVMSISQLIPGADAFSGQVMRFRAVLRGDAGTKIVFAPKLHMGLDGSEGLGDMDEVDLGVLEDIVFTGDRQEVDIQFLVPTIASNTLKDGNGLLINFYVLATAGYNHLAPGVGKDAKQFKMTGASLTHTYSFPELRSRRMEEVLLNKFWFRDYEPLMIGFGGTVPTTLENVTYQFAEKMQKVPTVALGGPQKIMMGSHTYQFNVTAMASPIVRRNAVKFRAAIDSPSVENDAYITVPQGRSAYIEVDAEEYGYKAPTLIT